jgi:hypothetical protein
VRVDVSKKRRVHPVKRKSAYCQPSMIFGE